MHPARIQSIRAFTRTELIVTIGCLALLVVIFLPTLEKAKAKESRIRCTSYLKNVGLSFRVWATDNHGKYPMQVSVTNGGTMELISSGSVVPVFRAMSNELSTPKILRCPADKFRTTANNFDSGLSETNISYFLNMDAREDLPSGLLSGDRNLTNRPPAGSRFIALTNTSTIGWTREIHSEKGNVACVDGSVMQLTNGDPKTVTVVPESMTNRLAVP